MKSVFFLYNSRYKYNIVTIILYFNNGRLIGKRIRAKIHRITKKKNNNRIEYKFEDVLHVICLQI